MPTCTEQGKGAPCIAVVSQRLSRARTALRRSAALGRHSSNGATRITGTIDGAGMAWHYLPRVRALDRDSAKHAVRQRREQRAHPRAAAVRARALPWGSQRRRSVFRQLRHSRTGRRCGDYTRKGKRQHSDARRAVGRLSGGRHCGMAWHGRSHSARSGPTRRAHCLVQRALRCRLCSAGCAAAARLSTGLPAPVAADVKCGIRRRHSPIRMSVGTETAVHSGSGWACVSAL